jgi:hypothetical protein
MPVSAPKTAKNAQPIMLATRSGTMVCVSKVATKKMAPTRANMLASVMLGAKILQQAIEQRVVGDVVGVEAQLDQDLCDPEIVRGRVENSIPPRIRQVRRLPWQSAAPNPCARTSRRTLLPHRARPKSRRDCGR